MSKATKVKFVRNEAMHRYREPDEMEMILKVLGGRGNNLHEVQDESGACFLVSMPTKFRKTIYIKKGSFVLGVPIIEGEKVKAEISGVFLEDDIRNLKALGKWPLAFFGDSRSTEKVEEKGYLAADLMPPSDSGSDEEEVHCIRINRPKFAEHNESEDSESDEDSCDDTASPITTDI